MLTLPIKKKWFDMILSGEKKEEYRSDSPYYRARLYKYLDKATTIRYRNGYSANSPLIEVTGKITIGPGNPEWGADAERQNTLYYRHHCETVKLLQGKATAREELSNG